VEHRRLVDRANLKRAIAEPRCEGGSLVHALPRHVSPTRLPGDSGELD
jgi:hypothetical protein